MAQTVRITPISGMMEFYSADQLDKIKFDSDGKTAYLRGFNATTPERFVIEGNNGQLFAVVDSSIGLLMGVHDISGMPIFEVYDDDRVVMGQFNQNTLVVKGTQVAIGTATFGSDKLLVNGSLGVSVGGAGVINLGDGSITKSSGQPFYLNNTVNVGGSLQISGTAVIDGSRNLTNIGTISCAQATTTAHAVRADRTISTTAPLAGGGDMTSNRTLTLGYNNPLYLNGANLDIYDASAIQEGIVTTGTQTFAGTKTFADLTVSGTLIVKNVQIQSTTTVEISDNLLIINKGEAGSTVSAGLAGIQIDRGSGTNYQFIFDETSDLFKVGMIGGLQAVATRTDTLADKGIAYWNNSTYALNNSANFTYDGTTLYMTGSVTGTTSSYIKLNNTHAAPQTIISFQINSTEKAKIRSDANGNLVFDANNDVFFNNDYGSGTTHFQNAGVDKLTISNQGVITATNGTHSFGALSLSGATATRLAGFDGSKNLVSTSAAAWVSGTTNRVTVTDDGDGTITLTGPQDLHTGASPTFASLTMGVNTLSQGDPAYFYMNKGLFVQNALYLNGTLNAYTNLCLLNKAANSFINFATRNTTGSEAVYDLTNIGSIASKGYNYSKALYTDIYDTAATITSYTTNTVAVNINVDMVLGTNAVDSSTLANLPIFVAGDHYILYRNDDNSPVEFHINSVNASAPTFFDVSSTLVSGTPYSQYKRYIGISSIASTLTVDTNLTASLSAGSIVIIGTSLYTIDTITSTTITILGLITDITTINSIGIPSDYTILSYKYTKTDGNLLSQGIISYNPYSRRIIAANTSMWTSIDKYSIGIGEDSLRSNTGARNTALGYQSLYSNTTGIHNSALGYKALYSLTIGQYNTAVGQAALLLTIGGSGNSAVGASALQSNTGNYNSALGYNALTYNTAGYSNSAFGMKALIMNTTGSFNTAVGDSAGIKADGFLDQTRIITDTYMTLIGYSATKDSSSQLTNSTAIGNQATVTASNQVVIGNTAVTQTILRGAITGGNFISTVATGTQPYACTSTTVNTNLNADLLDGNHAAAFSLSGHNHAGVYEPANANIQGHIAIVNGNPHGTTSTHVGLGNVLNQAQQALHGIEAAGTLSFDNSTHILTMASGTNTYWFQGVKYTTANAITCDLDTYVTLTTNTLYYVYFDANAGLLKASASFWNLKTMVPVATVFWNGSAGSIGKETHNHTRNLDWHINAHLTIGARYSSGLSLTNPTTTNDALLQIESGSIYDEDIILTIAQQTTARAWYKASANVFTFADISLPYTGTSGQPQYLNTTTYTLTNVANGSYVCMWVYASNDITRPIYIIPTMGTAVYNSVSNARLETAPNLASMGVSPEMKLLFRFIYKGDGQFQESADYRNSSSLPAGGSASTNASAVSFIPTGNIEATTVQGAVEELDNEKLSLTGGSISGTLAVATLTTSNTGLVPNLNADYLDGNHASAFALTGHNHTYDVNNTWLREAGDDANVKLYGNTRQMVFRTDGTTEYSAGIGTYPFVFMYGGDAAGNRKIILDADGAIYSARYGWLHAVLGASLAVSGNTIQLKAQDGTTVLNSITVPYATYAQIKNIDNSNEMTLANGFAAGGNLWLNYRGATAAITNTVIGDGMAGGGYSGITAKTFASNVVTGTAPLTVASTTLVSNLNADTVDGMHNTDFNLAYVTGRGATTSTASTFSGGLTTSALTVSKVGYSSIITFPGQTNDPGYIEHYENNNTSRMFFNVSDDAGSSDYFGFGYTASKETTIIYAGGGLTTVGTISSTIATGTAPLTVASTTLVTNLNSDKLDGYDAGNATGNIPVSNGTVNVNLNAQLLNGIASSQFVRNDSPYNGTVPIAVGNGNGLRFWGGSDDYKIAMGNGTLYYYGSVTDYSIKTSIDASSTYPGRGFTWGNTAVNPVASLNAYTGNFQTAGTINIAGKFTFQYNSTEDSLDIMYG